MQNRFRASNPQKARKGFPIGGKVIPETEFSVENWHLSQNMGHRFDLRFCDRLWLSRYGLKSLRASSASTLEG